MSKNRVTPHKPQREEKSPIKENRDLKQENRSLKKQLAKLRKQVDKMIDSHMAIQQLVAEEPDTLSPGPAVLSEQCEACKSVNLGHLKMPTGHLIVCKDCGHRKVKK